MEEKKEAIELHNRIKGREVTGTPCIYELSKFSQFDLLKFFKHNEILTFNSQDARMAGEIYRNLKNTGKLVGEIDIIISGIVKNRNLILVTRDDDFKKIPDLELELY